MKATPFRHGAAPERQPARDGSSVGVRSRAPRSFETGAFAVPVYQAAVARRAAFGAWVALTAVVVTAWKLASATSAACLAALWALS